MIAATWARAGAGSIGLPGCERPVHEDEAHAGGPARRARVRAKRRGLARRPVSPSTTTWIGP